MIYFDNNATIPVQNSHLQDVFAKLVDSLDANPSSLHSMGRSAKVHLEEARTFVAEAIGAGRRNIIFTSGATEGNNTVFASLLTKIPDRKPRVLISQVEHPSVFDVAQNLANARKIELFIIPVDNTGVVDINTLEAKLSENVDLVSIMLANNETGAINDLQSITKLVKGHPSKPWIHTDAVQGLGKMDMTWIGSTEIDFATFSAHKIGGFKGVGALYANDLAKVTPLLIGGGQERGLRSGTENTPGITSFGLQCRDIKSLIRSYQHTEDLRQELLTGLENLNLPICCNSIARNSLSGTVNISFLEELDLGYLFFALDQAGIKLSTGSACSSSKMGSNRVLAAMGLADLAAAQALRISLSGKNNLEEISYFLKVLRDLLAEKARFQKNFS